MSVFWSLVCVSFGRHCLVPANIGRDYLTEMRKLLRKIVDKWCIPVSRRLLQIVNKELPGVLGGWYTL